MKLSKHDFTGTGKVFAFTLTQYAKSPGSLVSLAIMLLFSLLSVPMLSLLIDTEEEPAAEASSLTGVYLANETAFSLELEQAAALDDGLADTDFTLSDLTAETCRDALSESELFIRLYAAENGYTADGYTADPTLLTDGEIVRACQAVISLLEQARLQALNVSPEQMRLLSAGVSVDSGELEEFLTEDPLDADGRFAIQYAYAIVVMILCLLSSTYIIRAIIEERASKLVELLMVSVKPLALVLGKILAMMVYVFGILLIMIGGFLLSGRLNTLLTGQTVDVLSSFGLPADQLNLGWQTLLIALISLLLSYLTFSIIAGIAGTGCSTMEDMESANMSVVLIVMAGYMVSCVVGAIPESTVAAVSALIPVVSSFCAPVSFVTGTIGWGLLVLSWIIQAVVVVLLALFCAKIYDQLILYRGRRLKLKDLLAMAKTTSGKEGH